MCTHWALVFMGSLSRKEEGGGEGIPTRYTRCSVDITTTTGALFGEGSLQSSW